MKRNLTLVGSLVVALTLLVVGCSKSKSDSSAMKGTWKGDQNASLVMSGGMLEFHNVNTNEWYKGTYTLREDTNPKQMTVVITECPYQQYVGKTANAIYRLENGTLTIAANEPGNPAVPAGFNAAGVSQMTFRPQ